MPWQNFSHFSCFCDIFARGWWKSDFLGFRFIFWLHFHEIWVFTFQKNHGSISGYNLNPHYFELRKSYRTDSRGWSRKIKLWKKNSETRKMNFKKKCYIQIVSNNNTFNLTEMDFWFRTKLAPWFFFHHFFAIFQGKLHAVKYGKMMNFHRGSIFCIFLSFSRFLTMFWPKKP